MNDRTCLLKVFFLQRMRNERNVSFDIVYVLCVFASCIIDDNWSSLRIYSEYNRNGKKRNSFFYLWSNYEYEHVSTVHLERAFTVLIFKYCTTYYFSSSFNIVTVCITALCFASIRAIRGLILKAARTQNLSHGRFLGRLRRRGRKWKRPFSFMGSASCLSLSFPFSLSRSLSLSFLSFLSFSLSHRPPSVTRSSVLFFLSPIPNLPLGISFSLCSRALTYFVMKEFCSRNSS